MYSDAEVALNSKLYGVAAAGFPHRWIAKPPRQFAIVDLLLAHRRVERQFRSRPKRHWHEALTALHGRRHGDVFPAGQANREIRSDGELERARERQSRGVLRCRVHSRNQNHDAEMLQLTNSLSGTVSGHRSERGRRRFDQAPKNFDFLEGLSGDGRPDHIGRCEARFP